MYIDTYIYIYILTLLWKICFLWFLVIIHYYNLEGGSKVILSNLVGKLFSEVNGTDTPTIIEVVML